MLFDWTSEVQDKCIEARFGIGRVRVRRLYNAGYVTPESLVDAGEGRIRDIVGQKMVRNAIRAVGAGDEIGGT